MIGYGKSSPISEMMEVIRPLVQGMAFMELFVFVFWLMALAVLAVCFGRDSRGRIYSKEEQLAMLGVTWDRRSAQNASGAIHPSGAELIPAAKRLPVKRPELISAFPNDSAILPWSGDQPTARDECKSSPRLMEETL